MGYTKSIVGVSKWYRRGAVLGPGWCIKQNRHFQTCRGVYCGTVFRVYKGYLRGIDGVQYLVLGGALSKTAMIRHLGGCVWGIEGVYKGFLRGVDWGALRGPGRCIKQNRHFQTC